MEPLLTVDEASEFIRLSPKTLYSYAERKIIPHVKLGSRLFFAKEKLEKWINENSIEMVKEGVN